MRSVKKLIRSNKNSGVGLVRGLDGVVTPVIYSTGDAISNLKTGNSVVVATYGRRNIVK